MRIRILCAALILWQPLQYALVSKYGEGYPLLQLPTFRGTLTDREGTIRLDNVDVEVTFQDDTTARFSSHALLSEIPSAYHQPIMAHMFAPLTSAPSPKRSGRWQRTKEFLFPALVANRERGWEAGSNPETKKWLTDRLHVLYPTRQPQKVVFVWESESYHTAAQPYTVTRQPIGVREVSLVKTR